MNRRTIDRRRAAAGALATRVMLVCIATLIGSVVFSACGGGADARLATFVGHWHGAARGLDVYRSGRGKEYIGTRDRPIVTLTFDVLRVAGTRGVADAHIRVTSVRITRRSAYFGSSPHKGELGNLHLRDGIIADSTTRVLFCAPGIDECDPMFGPDRDDLKVA